MIFNGFSVGYNWVNAEHSGIFLNVFIYCRSYPAGSVAASMCGFFSEGAEDSRGVFFYRHYANFASRS